MLCMQRLIEEEQEERRSLVQKGDADVEPETPDPQRKVVSMDKEAHTGP